MNIIVTGTLSYDHIMDYPGRFADRIMPQKIHNLSLSFLVDKLSKQLGGTAGNIGYTLRLLGFDPVILSVAGNDFSQYQTFLKRSGISSDEIRIIRKDSTSMYYVLTDRDDNQIGSFYLGATKYAKSLSITDFIKTSNFDSHDAFVVLAPTEPTAVVHYVRECRESGLAYIYDPAFQIAVYSKDELIEGIEGAKVVIGNDYETALIEQKTGLSHEELITSAKILITTLGPKGSIIETKTDAFHIPPAKPYRSSDPTGAGDCFRAGFLAGYLRGLPLDVCGRMGSVAAIYTVEKYGTVTHKFTIEDFKARYFENFGEKLSL